MAKKISFEDAQTAKVLAKKHVDIAPVQVAVGISKDKKGSYTLLVYVRPGVDTKSLPKTVGDVPIVYDVSTSPKAQIH